MKSRIAGIIIILISSIGIFHHLQFLYLYHNPNILWLAMYPTWFLILNIIIGFLGVIIGFKVYIERVKIVIGIIITFALIGFGLATDLFLNM